MHHMRCCRIEPAPRTGKAFPGAWASRESCQASGGKKYHQETHTRTVGPRCIKHLIVDETAFGHVPHPVVGTTFLRDIMDLKLKGYERAVQKFQKVVAALVAMMA